MQAVGPGVHVTRSDAKSVTAATQLELTPENFRAFMTAADSLAALEQRDSSAREYLETNIDDAGSSDPDAGLRWLQASPTVVHVIRASGLSVADYYVESLAIAAAQRFVDDPTAAPPSLEKNARLLQSHRADLDRLLAVRRNQPAASTKP